MGQAIETEIIAKFHNASQLVTRLNKLESPWHETNLLTNNQEGPVVMKTLFQIKPDEAEFDKLKQQMKRVIDAYDTERFHPNLLMYFRESPAKVEKSTRLIRQYVCFNLTEKIHWLPNMLTLIEKKWLVFQLLCGVAQIHSAQNVHGDIKPENVLITSYDWLLISDIHPYKPVLIKDDDLKTYNQYFGDLDNNIRCYAAPERWRSPDESFSKGSLLEYSMDIFSAGCVIAEILMDGLPLFDLARLQQFRRGTFDPKEELLKRIGDPVLVDLVMQMIDRDPKKRPQIRKCLLDWNMSVFPQSFSQVLYHLGASFQRINNLYSDNKISLIRYHINSIFETSHGIFNFSEYNLKEPTEPAIFNLIRTFDPVKIFSQVEPQNQPEFMFYLPSDNEEVLKQRYQNSKPDDKESLLIVAMWLCKIITSAFYPQSKLVALEMIQKISQYLPFQFRLNLVLPFLKEVLKETISTTGADEGKCSSNSKVKVKALDVILGLFSDLNFKSIDGIIIEALDNKVASYYIYPMIKGLFESSRNDPLVCLAVTQNLGRLTRIAARFLDIAISSSIKRHKEIIKQKDTIITNKFFEQTQFGAHRSTITSRREIEQQLETIVTNEVIEEDSGIPNYDEEMTVLWDELQSFIQTITSGSFNSAVLIALLQSFVDISEIFGVDKCSFLIQQCFSCLNSVKDFKIRVQALKTLGGMSVQLGQKQVEQFVLPWTELLLEDQEDLVILENIKMINYLVGLKLISKDWCINKLLQQLLPFSLYPNGKIRFAVATFVYLLTPPKLQQTNQQATVTQKPLINFDDFYLFVREKLQDYVKEYYYEEIMNHLDSAQSIIAILREPLSVSVMREFFNVFKPLMATYDFKEICVMADQFPNRHCQFELSHNDTLALNIVREIFKKKLRNIKKEEKQEVLQQHIDNQGRYQRSQYRLIRQSALQKLAQDSKTANLGVAAAVHQIAQANADSLTEDQKLKIVQKFSQDELQLFTGQVPIQPGTNYGLNLTISDPCQHVQSIPFEISQVLQSLNVVPVIPETRTFKNLESRAKGDISRFLRINSELQLAARGAQSSILDQFDYLKDLQKVNIKITDDHKNVLQNIKEKRNLAFKPQGTLITTLYEHSNPVNTVTVTDDKKFFMTGSRLDGKVHIWQVSNIQEDRNGQSQHSIAVKSNVNQICMIQNSSNLAVATDKGILLYDCNRIMQSESKTEPTQLRSLDSNEVLLVQSMQSPITYQNLLVAGKQSGAIMLYDLRSRFCVTKDEQVFKSQRGQLSALCLGKDSYTITVGTLGGYVGTYDIRYGVVSALFKHHLDWPVLALATYKIIQKDGSQYLASLVSTGGPQHELSQLNMETGQIDVLFKVLQNNPTNQLISRSEIPSVPEFYRETTFKDGKFGTIKRETNLGLLHRSLLNSTSHSFQTYFNQEGIRNLDDYFFDLSKLRFKRISEAFSSPNACRSILVQRDNFQSTMFDNETATYAITAGNDKKIRYWNLQDPESFSYQINTPHDDEVVYMHENLGRKGVKIVVEKPVSQKEFPKYTTTRIKDQQSTIATQSIQKNGKNLWLKYAENTSYHNTMASLVQGKIQSGNNGVSQTAAAFDLSHLQMEDNQAGYQIVHSIGGTSQGQHLNNLAITPDPIEDSTEHRIPDIVSHQDAVLDMAICDNMLITCGRDSLVKIWK